MVLYTRIPVSCFAIPNRLNGSIGYVIVIRTYLVEGFAKGLQLISQHCLHGSGIEVTSSSKGDSYIYVLQDGMSGHPYSIEEVRRKVLKFKLPYIS